MGVFRAVGINRTILLSRIGRCRLYSLAALSLDAPLAPRRRPQRASRRRLRRRADLLFRSFLPSALSEVLRALRTFVTEALSPIL